MKRVKISRQSLDPPLTKRVCRPSRWGNPFDLTTYSREESLSLYREWLECKLRLDPMFLSPLTFKNLGCYCDLDQDCHADILLEFVQGNGKVNSDSETVILALHPGYWQKIITNKKRFEFRKRANLSIEKIYVYLTKPVQQIVGYFDAIAFSARLPVIWEITKDAAGISYDEFQKYFAGSTRGYAFHISKVVELERPIKTEQIPSWTIPQSYRYIRSEEQDYYHLLGKKGQHPILDDWLGGVQSG